MKTVEEIMRELDQAFITRAKARSEMQTARAKANQAIEFFESASKDLGDLQSQLYKALEDRSGAAQ